MAPTVAPSGPAATKRGFIVVSLILVFYHAIRLRRWQRAIHKEIHVAVPVAAAYRIFFMLAPVSAAPRLSLHEWSCIRAELIWIYSRPPLGYGKVAEVDHRQGNWAWFFLRGHGWTQSASGMLKAREGMWLFPPREEVRQFFSPDCCILSVHFHCHWPSGQDVIASKEGLVLASERYPDLLRRARELERMISRHFPGHEGAHKHHSSQITNFDLFLRCQALFLNWLSVWFCVRLETGARLSRLQAGDDRTLKAVRCLNDAPLDQGYPRESLKAASGLSEVHLNRIFLRAYALTPRKYWERRQLEFARLCLGTSTIPVKEVAYRTGFRSVSHFVVWFRRHTRDSPGAFRSKFSQAPQEIIPAKLRTRARAGRESSPG